MRKHSWLILALFLTGVFDARAQSNRTASAMKISIPINDGWSFHEVGKDVWHRAIVPGCVHTDLLSNHLIEDPFYRDNEQKLQWIGKTDWEYRTTFKVAPEILQRANVELVFEGLDTYAEVSLNGAPLLRADNMFRTWRVNAKSALRSGDNTLLIRFRSPINEILPVMAKINYQLPASNDQGEKTSPYTRKAPYQYGWDWGPRFVTSGIWKPVSLEAWDTARINDLHIVTGQIANSAAQMTAEVEVIADSLQQATIVLNDLKDKSIAAERRVKLASGVNIVKLDFVIARPELWYPNGLGQHPLYTFTAQLNGNTGAIDETTTRAGIRTLELRQKVDGKGKSFEFVVNGIPVFAKGANWIPADSFPTRITLEKYRRLLASARDANMNMLRVWGGGIYESDDFYNLCDEMGILVWQDFMFACSMYPANKEFLDNVRQEAFDNVKRLRNHPSIAIWVGNNEVETAWRNWGWKNTLPAKLWDDYLKIFQGVLPEVCAALDPSRPYRSTSPGGGLDDDPDSLKSGDMHYWAVWHAALPFSEYEKQQPRFMSEYGFQSFPSIETVNTYTLPSDQDIGSPVMLAHQRHPRGNQLIREYMLREYAEPKDFASFLYVSQVLQAEGIKIGAEHLRRIMPYNMGSLYWQLDDCWPVASWSSIDYTGRWKALQFYARRFYKDLLISPQKSFDRIDFYVVSDRAQSVSAQLIAQVMDFDGNALLTFKRDAVIAPLQSKSYLTLPDSETAKFKDAKNVFLMCELWVDGKLISSNERFFQPYKNLSMPSPIISKQITATRSGFKISLSSDKFARAVYLSLPGGVDGQFSDNYFDLIPGKTVEVEYRARGAVSINDLRERLKVRSLADAF